MKVLVTGANGFLASNIVRELNRRGHSVRAMVRPTADLRSLSGTDHEIFYGNFINIIDAMEAAKGCDIVLHAAADTSQQKNGDHTHVNVTGTFNMLEASCKNQVNRFIFVSTANAFGYGTKENPGDENLSPKYPFTSSEYVISKINAQAMVLDYAKNGKLDAVVVNPTFMIGPNDAKPSSGTIITMMYNKKIIPVPPGGKNFVHVSDAAVGACNAIDKGKTGSCYLLANENLTYKEFFTKLEKVSGKSFYKIRFAPGVLNTLGTFGNLISKAGLKTNLNLINTKILSLGNYYSSSKAVKELNLPQTPADVAIYDALEWFKKNGYLK